MPTRQRKAERHRQKRRKHQQSKRLSAARSLSFLTGDAHPVHACVVNKDWDGNGLASIFLTRLIAPGRVTLAAFLVDRWAMGLKDAWGRVDVAVSEFNEMMERQRELNGVEPLNVGIARHLVYGGIELARELGFRLPPKYERWTAVLGPLPEGESPDMSLFRDEEGRIRLVCNERDLEARLIGTTSEKFLARPDVSFICGDDDFTLVDEDEDAFDEFQENAEQRLLEATRQWCFANGQKPHPLLHAVIGATLETCAQSPPPDFDLDADMDERLLEEEAPSDEEMENMIHRMASFASVTNEGDLEELAGAIQQFQEFMNSMDSPEDLADGLGIEK